MACLLKSFWTSSCMADWFWGLTSGHGGVCWRGVHPSSKQYPWTDCRTHRLAVIACQLCKQYRSLPERGSKERPGIWDSTILILSKVHTAFTTTIGNWSFIVIELPVRLPLKLWDFPLWLLLDLSVWLLALSVLGVQLLALGSPAAVLSRGALVQKTTEISGVM